MLINKNLFKYWTYQVFSPGTILRKKYEAFKSLLDHDKKAHELMAEIEEIYYNQDCVDFKVIEDKYEAFSRCVSAIVKDLSRICPTRYPDLSDYFRKFDFYVRFMLAPKELVFSPPFTIPLTEFPPDEVETAGGKAMNLSTIAADLNLPVPRGFIITTSGFYYYIEYNNLWDDINAELIKIDIRSIPSLDTASEALTSMILDAEIPPDIKDEIHQAFDSLWPGSSSGDDVRMAVRSSAAAEDSHSSFAGQYRTILNVEKKNLLEAYKKVLASKYSPEAIYYRINFGLSDAETPMAVLVLEMIDARSSGVMYTRILDAPETKQMDIHAIRGLGELLVGGRVSPDIITVAKNAPSTVVSRKFGFQTVQMVCSRDGQNEVIPVTEPEKVTLSIDDDTALMLAEWGIRLESHFQEPQDIEWCQNHDGDLFILQSRPLRTEDEISDPTRLECNFDDIANRVLLTGGDAAASGIGAGRIRKIEGEEDLENFPEGAVLVARDASPRYVRIMNRLNAVVTDLGSTAGHFSSVAREFGVPTLVNTGTAYAELPDSGEVTVHADGRKVYEGLVESVLASPCARRNLMTDSPFMRRLEYVMSFVSPLRLVDPSADTFKPEGCRSLHDIIRFAHEKAVEEMFTVGNRRIRKIGGSKKLQSGIPMMFYIIDVGGGLSDELKNDKIVTVDEIISPPMKALMKGLKHPDIQWGAFTHFDWAEHDKIVMSGGIISPEAAMFASHAIVSNDYANLNLRFGYHFVIVDTVCRDLAEDNYILFRFSGGGADLEKRMLRANFLSHILRRFDFEVNKKSDLVDAQLKAADRQTMEHKLDMLGRLLGATRLMDMYLKDASMVETYADEFMDGRYHFASEDMDE